ncbi:GIN domain-containing protein [Flavobacterium sp.]|uniref:GIN domain-containing protein n=1 Tax=Flavobacterium sp. TaxID=239 RepID=UPI002FDB5A05
MKQLFLILALLLPVFHSFSQKTEKIKASKIVTVSQKEIPDFENLEVQDDIKIFLQKGTQSQIEIEADDNTHEAFDIQSSGSTLRIKLKQSISGAKKTSLKITYTDSFKMLITKTDVDVTALSELRLNEITIKSYDDSRLFLNANCNSFTLITNDKSKIELNLKAQDVVLELSKNSSCKALINSVKLKCDMYQKSTAVIEGDTDELKLRLDNSSNFTGKNLVSNYASMIVEGTTKNSINVTTKLVLEASGKAETLFYGEAKVELKKFTDEAQLSKKKLK